MLKLLLLFPLWIGDLYAWNYNVYTFFQNSNTNGYYQSTLSTESDIYNTVSGTIQMSNLRNTLSAQYSTSNYKKLKANHNHTMSANWTYRVTKKHDYTFGVSTVRYSLAPTNVTDTSFDNTSGKVNGYWSKSYSKTQLGFLSLRFIYSNYIKDATRKDKSFDFSTGLQTYLGRYITLTPSFSINYLSSTNNYYNYYSLGPNIYFNYYPTDNLSFYLSGTYLYTIYSKRTFILTSLTGNAVSASEKQTLVTPEVGTSYNLTKHIPIQLSYSNTRNSSNNTIRDYRISVFSISISVNL
jgi:hypothetical protein